MRVMATKVFTYGDRLRRPGEVFEMSSEDARLLKGFEKVCDVPDRPDRNTLATKVMESEGDKDAVGVLDLGHAATKNKPTKGGRYRRTDLRAED